MSSSLVVQSTHVDRARAVSYHPEFPLFATCANDEVIIWRDDGLAVALYVAPGVRSVAFSPNGELAVAADRTIQGGPCFDRSSWWTLDTKSQVHDLAWLGDKTIVAREAVQKLAWYDLERRKQSKRIDAAGDFVCAGAASNAVLVHGSSTVDLFDGQGALLWAKEGDCRGAALHPTERIAAHIGGPWDGRYVEICDEGQAALSRVDAAVLGDQVEHFFPETLIFLPDGERLLIAGSGTFILWSFHQHVATYVGPGNPLTAWALRSDGARMVAAFDEGLSIWDLTDGVPGAKPIKKLKRAMQPSNSVTAHAGRIGVGLGTQVAIWSESGLEHFVKKCGTAAIYAVALVPGHDKLVCGSEAATAVLRDFTGEGRIPLKGPVGAVKSLAVAPDGSCIVVGRRRWDLQGSVAKKLTFGYDVAFLPDGERLLATVEDFDASQAGGVELRSVDGQTIRALDIADGHATPTYSLATCSTGRRLAVGRNHGGIALYDGAGELAASTKYGDHGICGLAFSPSGETLVSTSWNQTLALWSASDLAPLRTLTGFSPATSGNTVDFVSEEVLITLGPGGHAQLWHLGTGRQITLVAASPTKWFAYDDEGRYAGSKAGLGMLRVRGDLGKDGIPTLGKATEPTLDLGLYLGSSATLARPSSWPATSI